MISKEAGEYSHRCCQDGEHITRNHCQGRYEDLEAQTERVECRRDIRRDAQRHEYRKELSKVARRLEHCFNQATDVTVGVACLPRRYERC